MPDRADARGAADVEPKVGTALERGLTRMQAHAHTHCGALRPRVGLKRRMAGGRGRNRILRPTKRGEQLIGTTVNLIAARLRHGPTEQPPMLIQDGPVAIPELLHEPRRPFDVRK